MDLEKVEHYSRLADKALKLSGDFEERAFEAIGKPINELTAEECRTLLKAITPGYYRSEIRLRLRDLEKLGE